MKLLKLIAPLCVITTMLFAQSAFLSKSAPLYTEASEGPALGELVVASEVKTLSTSGDFTEVEFVGYMPEGSTIAYEKAGVLMVGFQALSPSAYKIIGQKKDEYDTVWLNVSVKGFVKTASLGADKSKIIGAGKALFQSKCGTCHALHPEDEFDANVWPSILVAMSAQAGLSGAERYSIEKYLQNFQK
ncbi:MAG: hypothetical protein PHR87_07770 [Sulfurospirillaceae bacterium]|nr:hypothetical protein [Sulfurospirillaceae bacterium]